MKKMFALVIALCCLLLAGCSHTTNRSLFGDTFRYDNPERYTVGGGALADPVKHLEIQWLTGRVEIQRGDGDNVEFEETANRKLSDELTMRWWLDEETLHIKFCNTGRWDIGNLQKTLTVTLPNDLLLESAQITTVSADIEAPELSARRIDWSTTSGGMTAQLFDTEHIDARTVSGTVDLTSYADAEEVEVDSTSGDVRLSLGITEELNVGTVSGKIQVAAVKSPQTELESTSGAIALRLKEVSGACKIGSVSGAVTLALPEDAQFSVEFKTVSGSFDSEIELSKEGETYLAGSGQNWFEVKTTSGSLEICKENG
ncbi:MAG: DUF4097 family beta strand repeat-containing protein [Oscillospiraceae bacterium]